MVTRSRRMRSLADGVQSEVLVSLAGSECISGFLEDIARCHLDAFVVRYICRANTEIAELDHLQITSWDNMRRNNPCST